MIKKSKPGLMLQPADPNNPSDNPTAIALKKRRDKLTSDMKLKASAESGNQPGLIPNYGG